MCNLIPVTEDLAQELGLYGDWDGDFLTVEELSTIRHQRLCTRLQEGVRQVTGWSLGSTQKDLLEPVYEAAGKDVLVSIAWDCNTNPAEVEFLGVWAWDAKQGVHTQADYTGRDQRDPVWDTIQNLPRVTLL